MTDGTDDMSKKVPFGVKPEPSRPEPSEADEWVNRRDMEAMKRMTIDIPTRLHAKFKARCAMRGTKMVDEIREWLEKEVG